MDSGMPFLRRSVRDLADRLDALLRRLEHHAEEPGDPRVQEAARPFRPPLARGLESVRSYAEELGASGAGPLARDVTSLVAQAASALVGGRAPDPVDTLTGTLALAGEVGDRLRGFAAVGERLGNARAGEIAAGLAPEVERLIEATRPLLALLFVERVRLESAAD